MQLAFGPSGEVDELARFLAECELPYEDITVSHLSHFICAREGDALVGVVGLELLGDVGLLRSLAVSEPCRMRGIGAQLVRRAETYARAQGIAALYLLTNTAEGYFEEHGYRSTNRDAVPAPVRGTTEFQSLCPATAVCMTKRL